MDGCGLWSILWKILQTYYFYQYRLFRENFIVNINIKVHLYKSRLKWFLDWIHHLERLLPKESWWHFSEYWNYRNIPVSAQKQASVKYSFNNNIMFSSQNYPLLTTHTIHFLLSMRQILREWSFSSRRIVTSRNKDSSRHNSDQNQQ